MPIKVEIADTSEKQMIGLMFRKSMPDNTGMLFKFNKPKVLSFWMANTYIPLDIAYLDSDMTVKHIDHMAPLSTRTSYSVLPCQYALEVPAGDLQKHGISIGKKLKLDKETVIVS